MKRRRRRWAFDLPVELDVFDQPRWQQPSDLAPDRHATLPQAKREYWQWWAAHERWSQARFDWFHAHGWPPGAIDLWLEDLNRPQALWAATFGPVGANQAGHPASQGIFVSAQYR